jgi:hypothetical protein
LQRVLLSRELLARAALCCGELVLEVAYGCVCCCCCCCCAALGVGELLLQPGGIFLGLDLGLCGVVGMSGGLYGGWGGGGGGGVGGEINRAKLLSVEGKSEVQAKLLSATTPTP